MQENEAFYKELGKRIALIRSKKGFTQAQLAELMGISRGRLSQIEIGRTGPDVYFLRLFVSKCSTTYQDVIEGANYTVKDSSMNMAAEPKSEYSVKALISRVEKFEKELVELKKQLKTKKP